MLGRGGLMVANTKNLAASALFLLIGGWFVYQALQMDLGTPLRMGPGFFPLVLACLLLVLGLAIGISAIGQPDDRVTFAGPRAILFILGPPILFGLTIRGFGFIPSVAMVVLATSFASRRMPIWLAAVLTVAITAFCYLVFLRGLGLPIRPFGPWLGF
jgi:hypothetical protein